MSLLPAEASFEEQVQEVFATFRGSGLMLSPLDVELMASWAELGVPVDVVARGIRRTAEKLLWDARPGEPVLRSLRACRREVESEIKKHRDRSAGASAESDLEESPRRSLPAERQARMRAALRKVAREHPGLHGCVERILEGPLAEEPENLGEVERREQQVLLMLLKGLPFPDRVGILGEAKARAREALALSGPAVRQARRFYMGAALRRALSLPTFW